MDPSRAADRVIISVIRSLAMTDTVEAPDRVAVLRIVSDWVDGQLDRAIVQSRDESVGYAELGRRLGVSRQAARQRVNHLRTTGIGRSQ